MPWISDATLKAATAATIGLTAAADAAANWDTIIPMANRWAYQLVRTVLSARGFTAAQIDALQDRVELNEQIGIDFALALGVKADDETAESVAEVRKRWTETLNDLPVAEGDEQVDPAGSGDVGTGSFDTSSDTFTTDSIL